MGQALLVGYNNFILEFLVIFKIGANGYKLSIDKL